MKAKDIKLQGHYAAKWGWRDATEIIPVATGYSSQWHGTFGRVEIAKPGSGTRVLALARDTNLRSSEFDSFPLELATEEEYARGGKAVAGWQWVTIPLNQVLRTWPEQIEVDRLAAEAKDASLQRERERDARHAAIVESLQQRMRERAGIEVPAHQFRTDRVTLTFDDLRALLGSSE